ncbi:MAG: hypothetical protein FJ210_07665 [Betaproteobacteria bacterium]|nr:hypothetical protein [Betaproteobacteria bacterium]
MSGYNEEAYQQARESVIDHPCPFERALLKGCVHCHLARKRLLAERELMTCTEANASTRCRHFLEAVHHNARFALHMDANQPWPFGKEIRAQCGGVLGLIDALNAAETDVANLLATALADAKALTDLPWSAIMRSVVHYEPRPRNSKDR